MPHRVANFLRTSSGTIPHIKSKKTARRSHSSLAAASPYTSDSDDARHGARTAGCSLADGPKKHHHHCHRHHHRLSLPFGRSLAHGGAFSSSASGSAPPSTVSLDCSVESPPVVFHGSPEDSTGALVSGQMIMDVKEERVEVDSFTACLRLRVTHRRPFQGHCAECRLRTTDVKTWRLLPHPTTTLRRGRHLFPFSALLGGHLPASIDSPVVSIAYELRAETILVRAPGSCVSARLERPLPVKRSLPEPLYPHNLVRVFPPTNIKASATYGSVIHPTGANRLTLKLDGLVSRNERVQTMDLWRLKKVTWRLEETIKAIAPACAKHAPAAAAAADDDIKGAVRTETRVLGEKQLTEGWKSDYSGPDGTADMEFDFCVTQYRPHARESKYACDLKTRDGSEVTHSLLIELIVSKEYAPEGKPHLATQTGTGRILRMHFAIVLTEFPGLGVSWDNEAPPVYQDVPPSPPGYPADEERPDQPLGPPVDYEDLEPLDARPASVEPRRGAARRGCLCGPAGSSSPFPSFRHIVIALSLDRHMMIIPLAGHGTCIREIDREGGRALHDDGDRNSMRND